MFRYAAMAGYPAKFFVLHPPEESAFWDTVNYGKSTIHKVCCPPGVNTFWEKLNYGLELPETQDCDYIVWVGNDHLAGYKWLVTMMVPESLHGVVAANDGYQAGALPTCGMIGRKLLDQWYGGSFPKCYKHNFGDTEISARARAEGRYFYAFNAVLFHMHPIHGFATNDAVYGKAQEWWGEDQRTFLLRQANGWRDESDGVPANKIPELKLHVPEESAAV